MDFYVHISFLMNRHDFCVFSPDGEMNNTQTGKMPLCISGNLDIFVNDLK